jgi:hypothetical protein
VAEKFVAGHATSLGKEWLGEILEPETAEHNMVLAHGTSGSTRCSRTYNHWPHSRWRFNNGVTRVREGFDNCVLRFLQALQVVTGAWNVNQLFVVGALTRLFGFEEPGSILHLFQ